MALHITTSCINSEDSLAELFYLWLHWEGLDLDLRVHLALAPALKDCIDKCRDHRSYSSCVQKRYYVLKNEISRFGGLDNSQK